MWKRVAILSLVLILAYVVYSQDRRRKDGGNVMEGVTELNEKNFISVHDNNGKCIIFFYGEYCPWSASWIPMVRHVAKLAKTQGWNIGVYKMNVEMNSGIASRWHIHGTPSIVMVSRFLPKLEYSTYTGANNGSKLERAIKRHLIQLTVEPSSVIELSNDQFQQYSKTEINLFVVFYTELDPGWKNVRKQINIVHDTFRNDKTVLVANFRSTPASHELHNQFAHGDYPTIILFQAFTKSEIRFHGDPESSEQMIAFINSNKGSPIIHDEL